MKKKVIFGCESRGDGDKAYLTRYSLFTCPLFSIYLHIFHRSDHDVCHDHPWPFASLILWRGYIEETPKGRARKWPGFLLLRRAEWVHRVELVDEKPAITLLFIGKRCREWGFHLPEGWLQWTEYFKRMGC